MRALPGEVGGRSMTRPCACGVANCRFRRPWRLFGFPAEPAGGAPCFFTGSIALGAAGSRPPIASPASHQPATERYKGGVDRPAWLRCGTRRVVGQFEIRLGWWRGICLPPWYDCRHGRQRTYRSWRVSTLQNLRGLVRAQAGNSSLLWKLLECGLRGEAWQFCL